MLVSELMSQLTHLGGPLNEGLQWADVDINGATIQSQKADSQTLFVACRGVLPTSKNGHDFIEQAIENGTPALLVEEVPDNLTSLSVPVWQSGDTRRDIALLSEMIHGHPGSQIKTIGITGTNGKSSVAFGLSSLLEALGDSCAVMGTLGFGHPENLENWGMTTPEAEVLSGRLKTLVEKGFTTVAMEVSSHALATQRVAGLNFDICVMTNLTHEHLDFHETLQAYYEAKRALFDAHSSAQGTWILPNDTEVGQRLQAELQSEHIQKLTWGATETADIFVSQLQLKPDGMEMSLHLPDGVFHMCVPWLGRFNAENIACIAACAHALGHSGEAIQKGFEHLKAPPGRMQIVSSKTEEPVPTIIVDYAHTPDALQNALLTVSEVCEGCVWVIFGCGGDRDKAKRPLMGKVAAQGAGCVVLTNDNPRTEVPEMIAHDIQQGLTGALQQVSTIEELKEACFCVELDRAKAIHAVIGMALEKDMVLIAGKGHETQQVLGQQTKTFDDVWVAQEALAKRSA